MRSFSVGNVESLFRTDFIVSGCYFFSSLVINSFCCFVDYVVGPSLNTISSISLVVYHGNYLVMHSGHSKHCSLVNYVL